MKCISCLRMPKDIIYTLKYGDAKLRLILNISYEKTWLWLEYLVLNLELVTTMIYIISRLVGGGIYHQDRAASRTMNRSPRSTADTTTIVGKILDLWIHKQSENYPSICNHSTNQPTEEQLISDCRCRRKTSDSCCSNARSRNLEKRWCQMNPKRKKSKNLSLI